MCVINMYVTSTSIRHQLPHEGNRQTSDCQQGVNRVTRVMTQGWQGGCEWVRVWSCLCLKGWQPRPVACVLRVQAPDSGGTVMAV
jgi:hypothetical protein